MATKKKAQQQKEVGKGSAVLIAHELEHVDPQKAKVLDQQGDYFICRVSEGENRGVLMACAADELTVDESADEEQD